MGEVPLYQRKHISIVVELDTQTYISKFGIWRTLEACSLQNPERAPGTRSSSQGPEGHVHPWDIYRATSLRNRQPVGPYRRPMPRLLGGSWGGGVFPHGRGTPADFQELSLLFVNYM